jgi:hypothetical protein
MLVYPYRGRRSEVLRYLQENGAILAGSLEYMFPCH